MPVDAALPVSAMLAFLLVLARVSGVVAFVPIPGLRNGPEVARIVFAVLLTWCLRPAWPAVDDRPPGMATLVIWLVSEAMIGIALGLFVSFLVEAFQLGAQILGIQAGYSYASTIDPTSQADSGVIAVLLQLMTGVCFFAAGVDRELIRAVAHSLERIPPGAYRPGLSVAGVAIQAGADMFLTGLRLALPVIAFLLLVDLALALLGRIQSQLQLLSLAFPAKMLLTLVLLASLCAVFPSVFQSATRQTFKGIERVLGG